MPLNLPQVTDATIQTSDITTNNSSTSKHGFLKKLSNAATEYMDGSGNWSTPAGTGAVASDTIWDAKGDLAGGTGANTAQKLTVGTNGAFLAADSTQTTGLAWVGPVAPWALMPYYGNSVSEFITVGAANRALYIPCAPLYAPVTITGMKIMVGTQSGNMSVGLFDSTGARVATSGAVAVPATGLRTVNFTAGYDAVPGRYYLGISADNVTATFAGISVSVGAVAATAKYQDTAHPLPTSITSAGESGRALAILGVITGGWPA